MRQFRKEAALELKGLESIAYLDPGMKAAVRRSIQLRRRCEAQQDVEWFLGGQFGFDDLFSGSQSWVITHRLFVSVCAGSELVGPPWIKPQTQIRCGPDTSRAPRDGRFNSSAAASAELYLLLSA